MVRKVDLVDNFLLQVAWYSEPYQMVVAGFPDPVLPKPGPGGVKIFDETLREMARKFSYPTDPEEIQQLEEALKLFDIGKYGRGKRP